LDVWNNENNRPGDDGFTDRVYVGDMNGYFYGIKFNFDETFPYSTSTNANMGIYVDIWPTKDIPGGPNGDLDSNIYRSDRQPITVAPVASFEQGYTSTLRVIFGTGKFDDIVGSQDDKTDSAKMSLYNLSEPVTMPAIDPAVAYEVFKEGYLTNLKVQINLNCASVSGKNFDFPEFNTGCTWRKDDANPSTTTSSDCCEKNNDTCAGSCYACIYDLTHPATAEAPAERFVGKPLIAGGLVFATSYVPQENPCAAVGDGYLYIFDYMCRPFPPGYSPVPDLAADRVHIIKTETNSTTPHGVQVDLGLGVPSKPILDSQGENIIVQMSDASLVRIPVNLLQKRVGPQGWRER
jgi:type IV pilus assembly protein PilY1